MREDRFYPTIVILACAINAESCVTYTPISAPALPTQQAKTTCPPSTKPAIEPIQVPLPVPATVLLDISPTQEPRADEGGWQLIEEYAAAQRNIKDLNKKLEKLNTNR